MSKVQSLRNVTIKSNPDVWHVDVQLKEVKIMNVAIKRENAHVNQSLIRKLKPKNITGINVKTSTADLGVGRIMAGMNKHYMFILFKHHTFYFKYFIQYFCLSNIKG